MDRQNVGRNLRILRKQNGMTQAQLAEEIGVSKDHLSHAEIGFGSISMPILLKVCKSLDVTPNDVLAGEYRPRKEQDDLRSKVLALDKIHSPKERVLLYELYMLMTRKQ